MPGNLEDGAYHLYLSLGRSLAQLRSEEAAPGDRHAAEAEAEEWAARQSVDAFRAHGGAAAVLKPFGEVSAFLGGGRYGSVFETTARGRRVAVKLVPSRGPRSSSTPPFAGRTLLEERDAQARFAAAGLAWPPLALRNGASCSRSAAWLLDGADLSSLARRNVAALLMPRVAGTLERLLSDAGRREELGGRLAALLRSARDAGLAHGDLKCNNVGFALGPRGLLDVRFIDFGRALLAEDLRDLGLSRRAAARALDLATAADARRLTASMRRHEARAGGGADYRDAWLPTWRVATAARPRLVERLAEEDPAAEDLEAEGRALTRRVGALLRRNAERRGGATPRDG